MLIHPSIVIWDYFEYIIPLMEKNYHLIIPALPGYDPDIDGDFTSVEEISEELGEWLIDNNLKDVACIYGCSMGGSIVVRMLAENAVNIPHTIFRKIKCTGHGGLAPFQPEKLVRGIERLCNKR